MKIFKFICILILVIHFSSCKSEMKKEKKMSKILKIENIDTYYDENTYSTETVLTLIGETYSVNLELEKKVELENKLSLTLLRHGHKNYSSGPGEPMGTELVVDIQLEFQGEEFNRTIGYDPHLKKTYLFTWNGFAIELNDYEYNKSHTVRVSKDREEDLEEFIKKNESF